MNRGKSYDDKVFCIADLEANALGRLPRATADYINGGSMLHETLRANNEAYDRYVFVPRYFKDVRKVDTTTVCLGKKVAFPVGISPSAMHSLCHQDAEVATARAAAERGINMILSTYTNTPVDVVAGELGGMALGQQLSKVLDEGINQSIIDNAEAAGASALFVTVDCPWLGRRLGDYRNSFAPPTDMPFPSFPTDVDIHNLSTADQRIAYDADLSWEKVRALKGRTKMQIWLKGILSPIDAAMAVEAGVDGILVSNHGGRQLDGAISTLEALPAIVEAVAGRVPVHIDGGIRRGSDIFKALALGAQHVWLGRTVLWGLAYKGQAGVKLVLDTLYDEFQLVMALNGCATVAEIGPHLLARRHLDGSVVPLLLSREARL
ncbi:FMN-dependent alpha-hydroxy acid dehydrogenase [Acaromyces ingoldii]|uniref:Oxidase FUB9 n=1 Tax=Acaromyces ingoldii TaxID=215250 RepID=A0A316YQE5_9BASI|nr:FMN-dependent alpha-hydroxy acid dehydrogenase [Acaromyces ingoldii]PWN91044.1 FMN-dependent alpha-hydroxy acid dehydrogenase [Acaromyces ingoldii]